MSILGGLMQGGGYALQAKPKTYESYGLAAVKSAADEGKRKSKERQQIEKLFAGILQKDGSKILRFQQEQYTNEFSESMANALDALERNDQLGAMSILNNFKVNTGNYVTNFETVASAIKESGDLITSSKVLESSLTSNDPQEVKDIYSKYGPYLGMSYNEKTGLISIEKTKKVNVENTTNQAVSGLLSNYNKVDADGISLLEKGVPEDLVNRVAMQIASMPGVKKQFILKKIEQFESDPNFDLATFPEQTLLEAANADAIEYISDIARKSAASQIGQGMSITNIIGDGTQQEPDMFSPTGEMLKYNFPDGSTPADYGIGLRNVQATENVVAAAGENVLDKNGVPMQKKGVIKMTQGNIDIIYSPDVVIKIDDLNKKLSKTGAKGFAVTSEDEKDAMKNYNITKEQYQELRSLQLKMKKANITEFKYSILSENQAIALNKIYGEGTVNAKLSTAFTSTTGEGRDKEENNGFVIFDIAKVGSSDLKSVTNKGKVNLSQLEREKVKKAVNEMNARVGYGESTTPSVNPPTGGSGGGLGGAKMRNQTIDGVERNIPIDAKIVKSKSTGKALGYELPDGTKVKF
jgi:hypothetical protein